MLARARPSGLVGVLGLFIVAGAVIRFWCFDR